MSSVCCSMLKTVFELLLALLSIIPYAIRAIVLTFVPTEWRAKSVKGDVVLITGGASGLGRMLCLRFAELGARIVSWDYSEEGNKRTAEMVKELGAECHIYTVDLSKMQEIYDAAAKLKADVGKVDILINNAGIVTGRNFLDCPEELIQKTMDVNINAHFWTVKSFLKEMISTNKGHIVTIASLAGTNGMKKLADYCASKFAAVGFDESLRLEFFANDVTGVHTTVVCPYFINTGMFDGVYSKVIPILEPDYVVDKIMAGILTNSAQVILPPYVSIINALKQILPVRSTALIGNALGITSSMNEFKGREKKD